jgi:hypothetical protein
MRKQTKSVIYPSGTKLSTRLEMRAMAEEKIDNANGVEEGKSTGVNMKELGT